MESPIVTLTTDWGTKDFFAGMVKGRLYSMIENVRVVDITHNIEPFHQSNAGLRGEECLPRISPRHHPHHRRGTRWEDKDHRHRGW